MSLGVARSADRPEWSLLFMASRDETRDEQQRRFRVVFPGLLLILALAALDQNIVTTALPRIVASLGGVTRLPWVVTSFLLAQTITTPLYGKLSDMYGRRPLFYVAVIVFLGGSCLCGMAQTMTQLIAFRGIQGLGAGGLMTLVQTTIGDFVAPRDRAKYQGYFSVVFTACNIAGPLLGGIITEVWTWRWIFLVNVPVGVIALVAVSLGLPKGRRLRGHKIDYAGIGLLALSTSCFLIDLGEVGKAGEILRPDVIALMAVAIVGAILLILCERAASEPVIPPSLFKNKVFVIATGSLSLNFMAMSGAGLFLPLFFQLVLGMSPAEAGLMTLPVMGGIILTSLLSGKLVSRLGRYKFIAVIGLGMVTLSDVAMAYIAQTPNVSLLLIVPALLLMGLGAGFVFPIMNMAIQNSVVPAMMGAATASSIFFRTLGASFGVTLAGTIMNWRVRNGGPGMENGGVSHIRELLESRAADSLRAESAEHQAIIAVYQLGLSSVYGMAAVGAALAFLLLLAMPENPLKTRIESESDAFAEGAHA
jgi:EmrB/QacA subfamily drug resistance transporter